MDHQRAILVSLVEKELQIPAKGAVSGTVVDLLGEGNSPEDEGFRGILRAEVIEGPGIVASHMVELPEQGTMFALNGLSPKQASKLYSAQFASIPDFLFTSLKLFNSAAEPRTVKLTPVSDEGEHLVQPVTVVLQPSEWIEEDAGSLFRIPEGEIELTDGFVGSLVVEVPEGGGVIGDVVFGLNDLAYAAALPLQTEEFTKAVFSHVANMPGVYFTGLALFNPGEKESRVDIEVYSPGGENTGSADIRLGAGERLSDTLSNLVPETRQQVGGFIVLASGGPMIAQELFGTVALTLLSAVPPKVLE
jgi:hypothetical protein